MHGDTYYQEGLYYPTHGKPFGCNYEHHGSRIRDIQAIKVRMHKVVDQHLDVITSAVKSARTLSHNALNSEREIKKTKPTQREEVLNAFKKLFYTD